MKTSAIAVLRRRYEEQRAQVAGIDDRMTEYFDELCEHSSAVPDDPDDRHNVYEVLGAVRFLRLLRTYEFNHEKVRMVIRLREGDWEKNGNTWRHLSGGLAQPGTGGAKVYRWAPFLTAALPLFTRRERRGGGYLTTGGCAQSSPTLDRERPTRQGCRHTFRWCSSCWRTTTRKGTAWLTQPIRRNCYTGEQS